MRLKKHISSRRISRVTDYLLALAVMSGVAIIAAYLASKNDETFSGNAIVADGDTVMVEGERIRLQGMDSPEIGQACIRAGKEFDCGRTARRHLAELIAGQTVGCTGWQRDKYDRLLATCRAGGVDLNRRMVEDGWAVSFGAYETEEAAAQNRKLGLWQGEFIRPREWRILHGKMRENGEQTGGISLNSLASRILMQMDNWFNSGKNHQ